MSKLCSGKLISNIFRVKQDQRGSALVMVAAALVVILGMMALVVDVGALALEKRKLQNACDAGALAAAQELPHKEASEKTRQEARENALDIGGEYLQLHNINETPDIDIYDDDQRVTVKVEGRKVNFIFAKVLGLDQGSVSAEATATLCPVKSIKGSNGVIGGVDPIGISEEVLADENFQFGKEYELISPENNIEIGPGNFGFLALGGNGDSTLRGNFKNGYKGTVDYQVDTKPGTFGDQLEEAIKTRECSHNPSCTPTSFEKDCPSLLTVVILEEGTVYGRKKVNIVGFATFLLSEVDKDKKSVTGYFIERTVPKNSEFIIDPDGEDFGLVAPRLIK